jgi:hypothetical protein
VSGPLPHWWCFTKTILRSAFITQLLFFFDMIAICRYTFIFFLKNPAAFKVPILKNFRLSEKLKFILVT